VTDTDFSEGTPVFAGDRQLGLADPTPETRGYWDGVAAGELRVRACTRCGASLHPRRIICPRCGSEDLAWRRAAGRGTIYSVSRVQRAPNAVMRAAVPYFLGIVELDEGVHLFARLDPGPGGREPSIGMRVEVRFARLESGVELPVFRPLGGS
jgi:uncharacterized OB-fold protein